jgi:hypothetical protein
MGRPLEEATCVHSDSANVRWRSKVCVSSDTALCGCAYVRWRGMVWFVKLANTVYWLIQYTIVLLRGADTTVQLWPVLCSRREGIAAGWFHRRSRGRTGRW